jgi:putative membrane protein
LNERSGSRCIDQSLDGSELHQVSQEQSSIERVGGCVGENIEEDEMNIRRTAIAAAAVGLMGSIALAQTAKMSPQEFATMAVSSDILEIRSSELAMQKSQTAAVQEFAQMMINDHTKASKDLMAAAQKDGVTVPAEMAKKHASKVEALNTADNEAFDAAYIDAQVAAHKEALALMSSYAESGDAAALKAHAQKTAPIIQRHFEHAQQLDK